MTIDRRRALNFGYNVLNLLREVEVIGGVLESKYFYLAGRTELGVRDDPLLKIIFNSNIKQNVYISITNSLIKEL